MADNIDHEEGQTIEGQAEPVLDLDAARESKAVQKVTGQPLASLRPMTQQSIPQEMTTQQLITWAILNDKVHLLTEVRAMQTAQQDREALLEFQRHFAEMQKDFVPVSKSREGQFGPYANINDILAVYSPILAAHGFSATFDEEDIPEKPGWKRVWSIISGYGHTKKTSFPCPPDTRENKATSAIQKEAGNTTYGKRQAFCSNVGVVLQDLDKDGATFEDGVKLGQAFQLIREATTQAARKQAYMTSIQGSDLTDREKVLIAEESKKKAKELHDAGVRE